MPSVTYSLTEKDLTEGSRFAYFKNLRSKRLLACYAFIVLLVTAVVFENTWQEEMPLGYTLETALLAVCAGSAALACVIALTYLLIPSTARKHFRQRAHLGDPITAEWSDEHVTFTASNGFVRYVWGDFLKSAESRSLFAFWLSDNMFHLIPKARLTAADIDSLRSLLPIARK